MGTSLQDDPIPRNRHASATRTPFYISLPLRVVGVRADGGYGSAPHACIVREPGPESSSFLLRVGPGSRIANDSMADGGYNPCIVRAIFPEPQIRLVVG